MSRPNRLCLRTREQIKPEFKNMLQTYTDNNIIFVCMTLHVSIDQLNLIHAVCAIIKFDTLYMHVHVCNKILNS